MPTQVQSLASYLDFCDEAWVSSEPGHLTHIMRRQAVVAARSHLTAIGTPEKPEICFERIRFQAIELQNCRHPVNNPDYHLQLRLRIFALIHWLADNQVENHESKLRDIAEEMKCPEIEEILQNSHVS